MASMRSVFCLLVFVLAFEYSSVDVNAMTWDSGWSSVVTGGVYCDQCLKQEIFPFGLPMNDAKISVECYDGTGVNVVASATATTNFLGIYETSFKGVSDLSGCKAFVTSSSQSSCSLAEGNGQTLDLKTKFFNNAFYSVDALFYKPAQPKGFCPGQSHPHPPFSFPPLPPSPPKPPAFTFPPFPPISFPPFPWKTPSTCAFDDWQNTKYLCRWTKATPFQTTVGQMFGKAAQKKYGNLSVYTALQSGDDLLRQAVAATMNANSNEHFYISAKSVKKQFNAALGGTQQLQWNTAYAFKQANSGYGTGKCMLTTCT